MISDKYKCIFIHIPKTGGNSIEVAFRKRGKYHPKWRDIQRQNPKKWESYFKFSFVRNPWDKAVSSFFYMRQLGLRREQSYAHKFSNFSDWIKYHDKHFNKSFKWYMSPQIDELVDKKGNIVVDFIGRFENFEKDFDFIKSKTGFPNNLPHVNKSSHLPWQYYYTSETFEIVKKMSQKDIKAFYYNEVFKPTNPKIFL
jgi:hypothetical protein